MAVRFVSEEFKQEVSELLKFFEDYGIEYDFEYLSDEDDVEDLIIDENYVLPAGFPHSYYEESHTIGELLDVVYEAMKVIDFNEYKLIGKRVALFYIDSQIQELIYGFGLDIPTLKR